MGRISWDDERTRKLLVILVDEKEKGCSKYNWPNIAKIFNAQTSLSVHGKQIQNHYGDLKEKFKSWEELQNLTGISFNPQTKEVDVEERALERWKAFLEKNAKYGLGLAKRELPNVDLLIKLFGGPTAHGVGGCFSPAMGRGTSYLTPNMAEGSGDSEEEVSANANISLSLDESRSPPRLVMQKECRTTSNKRKSVDTSETIELKRRETSFDKVIQLLSDVSTSKPVSRAQMVSEALQKLGVMEKGDEYFVSAMTCLQDEDTANTFLSLVNDNQKWIFLEKLVGSPDDDYAF